MNALIIVDIQNDFLPGGALAVPRGSEVIEPINRIQVDYDLVVATQDWHPPDHKILLPRTRKNSRSMLSTWMGCRKLYGRIIVYRKHTVRSLVND